MEIGSRVHLKYSIENKGIWSKVV